MLKLNQTLKKSLLKRLNLNGGINTAKIELLGKTIELAKTQQKCIKKAPEGANFINGGNDKPMLELHQQFICKLNAALNRDFIMQLKSFNMAA